MHGRLCCPSLTRKANAGQYSVPAHVMCHNNNAELENKNRYQRGNSDEKL